MSRSNRGRESPELVGGLGVKAGAHPSLILCMRVYELDEAKEDRFLWAVWPSKLGQRMHTSSHSF